MDNGGEAIFVRESSDNQDDVWDDTALIQAYDRAVNLAKDKVALRMVMETEPSHKQNDFKEHKKASSNEKSSEWIVGSPCRAIYSVDHEIYEATVTKIDHEAETCVVTFVGYGNTEILPLSELRRSKGLASQIHQLMNCQEPNVIAEYEGWKKTQHKKPEAEVMDYESEPSRKPKNVSHSESLVFGDLPPAPPMPPQLMSKLPINDSDALSSMLMSWYVSGFHTGYYQGIKQARNLDEKRKKQ